MTDLHAKMILGIDHHDIIEIKKKQIRRDNV